MSSFWSKHVVMCYAWHSGPDIILYRFTVNEEVYEDITFCGLLYCCGPIVSRRCVSAGQFALAGPNDACAGLAGDDGEKDACGLGAVLSAHHTTERRATPIRRT